MYLVREGMLCIYVFAVWFALFFVSVSSFPSGPVVGLEDVVGPSSAGKKFKNRSTLSQLLEGKPPNESYTSNDPVDIADLDNSKATSLDQQQDSTLFADRIPDNGCRSEDSTTDNGASTRKGEVSLMSRGASSCPANLKEPPRGVLKAPSSSTSKPASQRIPNQPINQNSGSDSENPCLQASSQLEYPLQVVHVSCGSHPVGDDPVYPGFVLNCVPGKPSS